jgi:hypothetical protein
MAVDQESNGKPNKVTPAREHAPAGMENTSIAASGGQEYQPGDVMPTPSMSARAGVSKSKGAWTGPEPSGTEGADA